jgi:hypothetical protein
MCVLARVYLMPNRKLTVGTIIVGLVLVLAAALNAHIVRVDAGGNALWNTNEAYFFIATDAKGSHMKWITFPFEVLREALGDIESPRDRRRQLFVVRITSTGNVDRHVLDLLGDAGPAMYTPIEGRIWAIYPALGGLCWWRDDHFEPASNQESEKVGGFGSLSTNSYRDKDGWSRTGIGSQEIELSIASGIELTVPGDGSAILMTRQDGKQETVLNIELDHGLVSAKKYQQLLHGSE